jgi:hemerythrin-like domain-containing protein
MSAVTSLSPAITTMIRLDHTHVLAAFRRFRADMANWRKLALVRNVCLAIEVHAQLEEEIFYPALLEAAGDSAALEKSVPEHDEMRDLILTLREMQPDDAAFDETFRTLIRTVLHHVADEETILLPLAEATLADQLHSLGAQMTRRRIELLAPHLGEAASTTARTFPVASALGLVSVAYLLWRVARPALAHSRLR